MTQIVTPGLQDVVLRGTDAFRGPIAEWVDFSSSTGTPKINTYRVNGDALELMTMRDFDGTRRPGEVIERGVRTIDDVPGLTARLRMHAFSNAVRSGAYDNRAFVESVDGEVIICTVEAAGTDFYSIERYVQDGDSAELREVDQVSAAEIEDLIARHRLHDLQVTVERGQKPNVVRVSKPSEEIAAIINTSESFSVSAIRSWQDVSNVLTRAEDWPPEAMDRLLDRVLTQTSVGRSMFTVVSDPPRLTPAALNNPTVFRVEMRRDGPWLLTERIDTSRDAGELVSEERLTRAGLRELARSTRLRDVGVVPSQLPVAPSGVTTASDSLTINWVAAHLEEPLATELADHADNVRQLLTLRRGRAELRPRPLFPPRYLTGEELLEQLRSRPIEIRRAPATVVEKMTHRPRRSANRDREPKRVDRGHVNVLVWDRLHEMPSTEEIDSSDAMRERLLAVVAEARGEDIELVVDRVIAHTGARQESAGVAGSRAIAEQTLERLLTEPEHSRRYSGRRYFHAAMQDAIDRLAPDDIRESEWDLEPDRPRVRVLAELSDFAHTTKTPRVHRKSRHLEVLERLAKTTDDLDLIDLYVVETFIQEATNAVREQLRHLLQPDVAQLVDPKNKTSERVGRPPWVPDTELSSAWTARLTEQVKPLYTPLHGRAPQSGWRIGETSGSLPNVTSIVDSIRSIRELTAVSKALQVRTWPEADRDRALHLLRSTIELIGAHQARDRPFVVTKLVAPLAANDLDALDSELITAFDASTSQVRDLLIGWRSVEQTNDSQQRYLDAPTVVLDRAAARELAETGALQMVLDLLPNNIAMIDADALALSESEVVETALRHGKLRVLSVPDDSTMREDIEEIRAAISSESTAEDDVLSTSTAFVVARSMGASVIASSSSHQDGLGTESEERRAIHSTVDLVDSLATISPAAARELSLRLGLDRPEVLPAENVVPLVDRARIAIELPEGMEIVPSTLSLRPGISALCEFDSESGQPGVELPATPVVDEDEISSVSEDRWESAPSKAALWPTTQSAQLMLDERTSRALVQCDGTGWLSSRLSRPLLGVRSSNEDADISSMLSDDWSSTVQSVDDQVEWKTLPRLTDARIDEIREEIWGADEERDASRERNIATILVAAELGLGTPVVTDEAAEQWALDRQLTVFSPRSMLEALCRETLEIYEGHHLLSDLHDQLHEVGVEIDDFASRVLASGPRLGRAGLAWTEQSSRRRFVPTAAVLHAIEFSGQGASSKLLEWSRESPPLVVPAVRDKAIELAEASRGEAGKRIISTSPLLRADERLRAVVKPWETERLSIAMARRSAEPETFEDAAAAVLAARWLPHECRLVTEQDVGSANTIMGVTPVSVLEWYADMALRNPNQRNKVFAQYRNVVRGLGREPVNLNGFKTVCSALAHSDNDLDLPELTGVDSEDQAAETIDGDSTTTTPRFRGSPSDRPRAGDQPLEGDSRGHSGDADSSSAPRRRPPRRQTGLRLTSPPTTGSQKNSDGPLLGVRREQGAESPSDERTAESSIELGTRAAEAGQTELENGFGQQI